MNITDGTVHIGRVELAIGDSRRLLLRVRVGGDGRGKICICCLFHCREKLCLPVEQLKQLLVPWNDGVDLVGGTHGGVVGCRGSDWL